MRVQVTLVCESGKYKPVSAIVDLPDGTTPEIFKKKGIEKICVKRYWTVADLKKYGYTKIKMRKAIDK